LLCRPF
ncbi:putative inhibitor of cell division, partial [Escherichia coli EC1869]